MKLSLLTGLSLAASLLAASNALALDESIAANALEAAEAIAALELEAVDSTGALADATIQRAAWAGAQSQSCAEATAANAVQSPGDAPVHAHAAAGCAASVAIAYTVEEQSALTMVLNAIVAG